MAQLVIGPMLRYLNSDSATIWVETDAACEVEVCGVAARTFACGGHHFGLVVLEGLSPASTTEYRVSLDGREVWPLPGSRLPPSVIRTPTPGTPTRLVFGSCRSAAPHEPPYTLRLDDAPEGRGVDALRATGLRMLDQDPSAWPDLLLFGGDQVYADDQSPVTGQRIRRRRGEHPDGPPPGVVADFEEYTWLYHESWSQEIERWVLSTVPSAMIFDDHDMIDDWNISRAWVNDIRATSWWPEHVIGGLVSYWIYQHLGNLSPRRLQEEGMLEAAVEAGDATELLRRWALSSEEFTPVPGGYQFSFERHLGDVHLVVVDCRNGRVLDQGHRQMVDDDEWTWIRERSLEPAPHVVIAASLPVFVPGGLHGIQQWNEAVCDGVWGRRPARWGERLRRSIDLEGWPAFDRSFRAVESLLIELSTPTARHRPPSTISILGGDIHFSYVAPLELPDGATSEVAQIVCSPIRNILRARERRVMRFGSSRAGRRVGRWLMRRVGRTASAMTWEIADEPVFDNAIATITFTGAERDVVVEVARVADDGGHVLAEALRFGDHPAPAPQPS